MTKTPLALTSSKQRQGAYFEQLALEFLRQQGLILIAKNWLKPKVGELDLVMLQKGKTWDTLVFVEVRQRKKGVYGDAATSITAAKQKKIIKTAQYFLRAHTEYQDCECRFDVVVFDMMVDKSTGTKSMGIKNANINLQKKQDRVCASANANNISNGSSINKAKQQDNVKKDSVKPALQPEPQWIAGAFIGNAWG